MQHDIALYIQALRATERREIKAPLRSQIEEDIEKFLSKGNEITKLASNQRREESNVPQQDPKKRSF
jgi:hypothetical protein